MELIGKSNDRQISYVNTKKIKNWIDNLPTENWLAFTITEDEDLKVISDFAKKCLNNNLLYLCAVGKNCEHVHDIFDEVIIEREIQKNQTLDAREDFQDSPVTVWDNNFSGGFWFSTICPHHEKLIETIVCIDFTTLGVKNHLQNLIKKINDGWLPSDEYYEKPIFDL